VCKDKTDRTKSSTSAQSVTQKIKLTYLLIRLKKIQNNVPSTFNRNKLQDSKINCVKSKQNLHCMSTFNRKNNHFRVVRDSGGTLNSVVALNATRRYAKSRERQTDLGGKQAYNGLHSAQGSSTPTCRGAWRPNCWLITLCNGSVSITYIISRSRTNIRNGKEK
jgi:hypothetical protein